MADISSAEVLGADIVGSETVSHLANASVVLLGLDAQPAAASVTRQLKAAVFMDPDSAARVRSGSAEYNLGLLLDPTGSVRPEGEAFIDLISTSATPEPRRRMLVIDKSLRN
jgi:hypothetical protein